MERFLAIQTAHQVKFYKIGKSGRPLTVVRHRLFRTDESLMVSDRSGGTSFVLYDLEDTQPYGHGDYLDPDFTKTLIDSGKDGSGVRANKLDSFFSGFGKWGTTLIVLIVIVYALAMGGI